MKKIIVDSAACIFMEKFGDFLIFVIFSVVQMYATPLGVGPRGGACSTKTVFYAPIRTINAAM
jgi:hypothetical protein